MPRCLAHTAGSSRFAAAFAHTFTFLRFYYLHAYLRVLSAGWDGLPVMPVLPFTLRLCVLFAAHHFYLYALPVTFLRVRYLWFLTTPPFVYIAFWFPTTFCSHSYLAVLRYAGSRLGCVPPHCGCYLCRAFTAYLLRAL